jgi:hypothetical protein
MYLLLPAKTTCALNEINTHIAHQYLCYCKQLVQVDYQLLLSRFYQSLIFVGDGEYFAFREIW